jgi:8-oxo-dGTP pyrophosphatase MutT (NUDIX family)
MEYIDTVLVTKPVGNLFRKQHVSLLIKTTDEKFLFGNKAGFYPHDFARFLGGGIEGDELPIQAAQRELQEELHIHAKKTDVSLLGTVITDATDADNAFYSMQTHIFYIDISDQEYTPSDDISSVVALNRDQANQLIEHMLELIGEHRTPDWVMYWKDYGRIYHTIHQKAFEWLDQKSES